MSFRRLDYDLLLLLGLVSIKVIAECALVIVEQPRVFGLDHYKIASWLEF